MAEILERAFRNRQGFVQKEGSSTFYSDVCQICREAIRYKFLYVIAILSTFMLTVILVLLYLCRILFRFLSNYLAHKAAWNLVGDLRTRTYDKLERMHIGYFHDKQTGDLMSRIVNDTRDFELLYAHMIPDTITNVVAFLLYLGLFYAPITGLANLLENMQQSMAGAERVMDCWMPPARSRTRKAQSPFRTCRVTSALIM